MILVGVPSQDYLHADFAVALAAACVTTVQAGHPLMLSNPKASHPTQGRNAVLRHGNEVADQLTHFMWLDSDMVFPADVITRLLAHDKDIVGASYAMRRKPHMAAHLELDYDGKTPRDEAPLARVAALPGGCLLVKADVYRKIGQYQFTRDGQGEDYTFCQAATANGYEMWLDRPLSREIVHLASCTPLPFPETGLDARG